MINFIILLLILWTVPGQTAADRSVFVPSKITCVTSACHADISSGRAVVHGPVKAKGCHVCHLISEAKLALPSGKLPKGHPTLLKFDKAGINSVCLMCHDSLASSIQAHKVVHKAITEKTCVGCHNPHSSNHKSLLKFEPKDAALCLSCHDKFGSKLGGQSNHHGALSSGKNCLNCHDPHFSNLAKLLKKPSAELCLDCHSKEIKARDGHTIVNLKALLDNSSMKHDPVENGQCLKCHSPHGSNNPSLLLSAFSRNFYGKFNEEDYPLCFKCHDTDLATVQRVTEQTGFRNGDKNMHYFHLNEQRKGGIGCGVCHEVHASSGPKLIRQWTPFHGMLLPIKFEASKNGGGCLAACHGLKKYDRVQAVINEKGR